MATNKNHNVDLASLSGKKIIYHFAKEMNFNVKDPGNKSTRDRTLLKLLESPGTLVSASSSQKATF